MVSYTNFIKFWHNALEPKFKKYRHILQGDLLRDSQAKLTELPIKQWMKVIDVGGIWENMCIKMREDFASEEKLFWNWMPTSSGLVTDSI